MSTQPLRIPIRAQSTIFKVKVRGFNLLNSAPEPIETKVNGRMYTVPARDQMDRPEPATATTPAKPFGRAALDADGDPIPGSVRLVDEKYLDMETGREEYSYDAEGAVRLILGLRERPDGSVDMTSRLALKGLSFLPDNPTKELVQEIRREGAHRNLLFQADIARRFVETLDAANEKRQEAGMPPMPGGPEYVRAKMILERADAEIREALGYGMAETPAEAFSAQDLDKDPGFIAYAEAEAMKLAKDAAREAGVDEAALARRLLEKPAVRARLQKEWRIRKVGHIADKPDTLKSLLDEEEQREARLNAKAGLGPEDEQDTE